MDIGDGERWLIMMLISFIYGFAMRHFITMPIRKNTKPIDYDGTNGKGYQPRPNGLSDIHKPPRRRPTPPGAE